MPKSKPRLNLFRRPKHQRSSFSHKNSGFVSSPEALNQNCSPNLSFLEHLNADQRLKLPPVNGRVEQLVLLVLADKDALLIRVFLVQ